MLYGEKGLAFIGSGTVVVVLILLLLIWRPIAKKRRRKRMLARRGPTPSNISWEKPFDRDSYRNLPMLHKSPEEYGEESWDEMMDRLRADQRRWEEEDAPAVARLEEKMKQQGEIIMQPDGNGVVTTVIVSDTDAEFLKFGGAGGTVIGRIVDERSEESSIVISDGQDTSSKQD